ncbi:MAG: PRC-barrel domain-containing protein [Syntrophomonas sp.]|nr:PRC-barrel domain-containing protein [Syntrophomonas sp.]
MKRSQEIIDLPVFSIIEGTKIGQVKDLVINPEEGRVEFILVSNGSWYVGARILPYKAVMGVGEHAVTTESENLLATINDTSNANSLLQRNIKVKGNRVLTNKGNLIGIISEYEIDEKTGKVVRLEYKTAQDESVIDSVQAEDVLTYGSDVIVIREKVSNLDPITSEQSSAPQKSVAAPEAGFAARPDPVSLPITSTEELASVVEPAASQAISAPTVKSSDGTSLFKERQKQFLLGKKVIQDIRDSRGSVIIQAGTIVTEEVFNMADKQGKFMELSEFAK